MQDSFICSSRSVSATHLWLWRIGFLFFPQGQISKSGRKLKNQTFRWTDPASETAASLSCLDALAPSPPGKKWYNSTTMLMKSRFTWWKMKELKSVNKLSNQTKKLLKLRFFSSIGSNLFRSILQFFFAIFQGCRFKNHLQTFFNFSGESLFMQNKNLINLNKNLNIFLRCAKNLIFKCMNRNMCK